MKFAQFLAVGIAMASAAAFAGGDKRSSQSSEQQNTQAPRDQQAQISQGEGSQQDQETVKQAQEQLSLMGHDAGPVDGIMGPKTQAAVKEFQESKGLQVSGRLDNQTLAALQTGGSEGRSSSRSSGSQSTGGQAPGNQSSSGQSMSSQPSGAQSPAPAAAQQEPSSAPQRKY
jgi:peptidoglycan hydrolase-like protein with peptidoglycan-binding domain